MATPLLIPRNTLSALVENESSFEELIKQLSLTSLIIRIRLPPRHSLYLHLPEVKFHKYLQFKS